ncbi:MAG: PAS domain-containing sensor histidine kinase [Acetobacterales bacterium]
MTQSGGRHRVLGDRLKALGLWLQGHQIGRKATIAFAMLAAACGVGTYLALSGEPPEPEHLRQLIQLNVGMLVILAVLVCRRIFRVWVDRRRGSAGSKLHIRLVVVFALVAVTPTVVVAVLSLAVFDSALTDWFSTRVRTALRESLSASQAYLRENSQEIVIETRDMALDLNRTLPELLEEGDALESLVSAQARVRRFSSAAVIGVDGHVYARYGPPLSLESVPDEALDAAVRFEIPSMTAADNTRLQGMARLDPPGEIYLMTARPLNAQVFEHMAATQRAVRQYEDFRSERSAVQIGVSLIFLVLALLFVMVAMLIGLVFANRLARPLTELVFAAEQVRAGNLSARVPEINPDDEVGTLVRSFNRMTSQLEAHREELMEANRQVDTRRRFTETVLAGVSAGVIGLDRQGRINLPNRSASTLLQRDLKADVGRRLLEVVPEMSELFQQIRRRPARPVQGEIRLDEQGAAKTLLVRMVSDRQDKDVRGYVVTFDDVTELLAAQREAAWSDVARRIAHEIKNPLTPIQLSAERLKRKYLDQITSDRETFTACTDTIVRQVGDIGRMVDEFSAFARMPSPTLKPESLKEICSEAVFLQRTAHPAIRFEVDMPKEKITVPCDRRQMGQAVTNLLQNAVEAIEGRMTADAPAGEVRLVLRQDEGATRIVVEDNGPGLPVEGRENLTEPYVTTRLKGTGLGLAIVKKIMEDHAGSIALEDRPEGGARVSLLLNSAETRAGETEDAAANGA